MRTSILAFFVIISLSANSQTKTSTKIISLMGSRFELIAISVDEAVRESAIDEAVKEIKRIENIISSWLPGSETANINSNAGIKPMKVSEELFDLIERSIKVSKLTNGAFDISFSSINAYWTFDGRQMDMPDSSLIQGSVSKINYKNIVLNRTDHTVYLHKKGMKIGFGAIGKGYAANRAKVTMTKYGIKSGMINAGGDLIAWGNQEDGTPWQIGIADPSNQKDYIAWLNVGNMSVVTSGNYEKYVIIEGKKYGHIINPKTGFPVEGIQSVTLVSPDAELSDALSTSVFVLGISEGMELVNKLKNVECLIIDDKNKIWTSNNLKLNYYD